MVFLKTKLPRFHEGDIWYLCFIIDSMEMDSTTRVVLKERNGGIDCKYVYEIIEPGSGNSVHLVDKEIVDLKRKGIVIKGTADAIWSDEEYESIVEQSRAYVRRRTSMGIAVGKSLREDIKVYRPSIVSSIKAWTEHFREPGKGILNIYARDEGRNRTYKTPPNATYIDRALEDTCHIDLFEVGDSVTALANTCFKSAQGIDTVVLGTGIDYIPSGCFEGTDVYEVKVRGNLKWISRHAFQSSCLREFEIPDSVVSVGNRCFAHLKALRPKIKWGKGLKVIPENCFIGNNWETISVPEWVEEIRSYAFASSPIRKIMLGSNANKLGSDIITDTDTLSEVVLCGNEYQIRQFPWTKVCSSLVKTQKTVKVYLSEENVKVFEKAVSQVLRSMGLVNVGIQTFIKHSFDIVTFESLTPVEDYTLRVGYRKLSDFT